MPFPLQKSPLGLLGAFDLKTLGSNPSAFGEVVTPVAEVLPFYTVTRRISYTSATTDADVFATQETITVPDGKVWRLLSATAVLNVPAAATLVSPVISFVLGFQPLVNTNINVLDSIYLPLAPGAIPAGGGFQLRAHAEPTLLVLPAGYRVVGQVLHAFSAASNTTIAVTALVEEFDQ